MSFALGALLWCAVVSGALMLAWAVLRNSGRARHFAIWAAVFGAGLGFWAAVLLLT